MVSAATTSEFVVIRPSISFPLESTATYHGRSARGRDHSVFQIGSSLTGSVVASSRRTALTPCLSVAHFRVAQSRTVPGAEPCNARICSPVRESRLAESSMIAIVIPATGTGGTGGGPSLTLTVHSTVLDFPAALVAVAFQVVVAAGFTSMAA